MTEIDRSSANDGVQQYVDMVARQYASARKVLAKKLEGEQFMVVASDFESFAQIQQRAHLMKLIANAVGPKADGSETDLVGAALAMIKESERSLLSGWEDSRYTSDWANGEQDAKRAARRWLIDSLSFVRKFGQEA
jgi:hypothetical protein